MLSSRSNAVLMAALVIVSALALSTSAWAQNPNTGMRTPAPTPTPQPNGEYRVRKTNGFAVAQLKDLKMVGDNRCFIITNPTGFMVYKINDNGLPTPIAGYEVAGLKDLQVMGDGKTIIVTNTTGFMVYQLEQVPAPAKK